MEAQLETKAVQIQQAHRARVTREIFLCEQTFVKTLQAATTLYMNPLEGLCDRTGYISSTDHAFIFREVNNIFTKAQLFLHSVEFSLKEWANSQESDLKIGSDFQEFMQGLDVYKKFGFKRQEIKDQVEKLMVKKKRFKAFVEEQEGSGRLQKKNTPFDQYFDVPIRHLDEIKSLLKELLMYTPEAHSDFVGLSKCSDKLVKIIDEITKRHRYNVIMSIEETFTTHPEFLRKNRIFMRQGPLMSVSQYGFKHYVFFLFNDLIAYAVVMKGGNFKLRRKIAINELFSVKDVHTPDDTFGTFCFVIEFPDAVKKDAPDDNKRRTKKLTLIADSENSKLSWIEAIKTSIALSKDLPERHGESSTGENTGDVCCICKISFSLFRLKHVCGICARLVCADCSPRKISIAKIFTLARICIQCALPYTQPRKRNAPQLFSAYSAPPILGSSSPKRASKSRSLFASLKSIPTGFREPDADSRHVSIHEISKPTGGRGLFLDGGPLPLSTFKPKHRASSSAPHVLDEFSALTSTDSFYQEARERKSDEPRASVAKSNTTSTTPERKSDPTDSSPPSHRISRSEPPRGFVKRVGFSPLVVETQEVSAFASPKEPSLPVVYTDSDESDIEESPTHRISLSEPPNPADLTTLAVEEVDDIELPQSPKHRHSRSAPPHDIATERKSNESVGIPRSKPILRVHETTESIEAEERRRSSSTKKVRLTRRISTSTDSPKLQPKVRLIKRTRNSVENPVRVVSMKRPVSAPAGKQEFVTREILYVPPSPPLESTPLRIPPPPPLSELPEHLMTEEERQDITSPFFHIEPTLSFPNLPSGSMSPDASPNSPSEKPLLQNSVDTKTVVKDFTRQNYLNDWDWPRERELRFSPDTTINFVKKDVFRKISDTQKNSEIS